MNNTMKIKEFLLALVASINKGTSDGKQLCKLIVDGVRDGILYPVKRDPTGRLIRDENGETIRAELAFGNQLIAVVMELYLQLAASDPKLAVGDEKTPEFGELKRIVISGCRYAAAELGLEWAPEAEVTSFSIKLDSNGESIASTLRKKLPQDKLLDMTAHVIEGLNKETREAFLKDLTGDKEPTSEPAKAEATATAS